MIKRCNTCGRFLGEDDFYWQYNKTDCRRPDCKRCSNNNNLLWREDNKDKIKIRMKVYRPEYYKKNKEKLLEMNKIYQKNNPDKVNAKWSKYKAMKLNATPDNANLSIIQFYYTVASTMADYEVDHIKPLSKGGLHHENNLQILEISLNRQKYNKWPLTKEEEIKYKGFRL